MGALVNLRDLGVSEEALNGELLGVTVAAENLNGSLGDPHGGIAGEQLGHAGLLRVSWAVGMVVLLLGPCSLVDEQACGLDLRRHVGKVGHDHLMVGDGFAERLALVSVLQGRLVGALSDTKRLCSDANTTVVKGIHGDGEAVSDTLDGIFNRNFAVVQHEGARVRRTNTKFVLFLADREAFVVCIDDEGRGAAVLL